MTRVITLAYVLNSDSRDSLKNSRGTAESMRNPGQNVVIVAGVLFIIYLVVVRRNLVAFLPHPPHLIASSVFEVFGQARGWFLAINPMRWKGHILG